MRVRIPPSCVLCFFILLGAPVLGCDPWTEAGPRFEIRDVAVDPVPLDHLRHGERGRAQDIRRWAALSG
jgi:hypothetical protein